LASAHDIARSSTGSAVAPGSTVLLVEDDPDVRDVLAAALSKHFHLLVAGSGSQALPIIAGQPIDLLLTDIVMPDMNGFELAEKATAMRPGLRVIYMTGYADRAGGPVRARHGKLIGKPVRPVQLVSEIRAALGI
jgi:DNA-binding NtrC family response regulator